jgi:hypothetical protein
MGFFFFEKPGGCGKRKKKKEKEKKGARVAQWIRALLTWRLHQP